MLVSLINSFDYRYQLDKKTFDFSLLLLTEIAAVNGSGPVDLRFHDRLRKESRMANDSEMFDG